MANKKRRYKKLIAALIFCLLVSLKSNAQPGIKEFHIAGFAQGTTYNFTYYAKDSIIIKKQTDSILVILDSSLSIYKPWSLITQFNNASNSVEMNEHLNTVVRKSLEIYKETSGISDITVYPLVAIWGFGPASISELPDSSDIKKVLPCVGSDKIYVENKLLFKKVPCVKIDVNGIAQGYSVDVIADFFEKKGIQNYLVEIGGELRIKGRKQPGGESMQIGIESPAKDSTDQPIVHKVITPDEGAITTSGNYRKYRQNGNKKVSHILNPQTGYPSENELISVTVWAKDAITADGYDNALMAMGLRKALQFLKKHKNLEAYFIYRNADGSVSDTATTGFYKYFKLQIMD